MWINRTHVGDCRELLSAMAADGVKVQTCVTSPPYFGLRDYGCAGQIGLEPDPMQYVAQLVVVFDMVRELLTPDGTLWLNLGDSYSAQDGQRKTTDRAGLKQQSNVASVNAPSRCVEGLGAKQLIGIPWRVAFALQANGWYLRSDIIWHKPNPMPESVTDRPTKAHEYLFLLAKSERYYYDAEAIQEEATGQEPGNKKPTKGGREYQDAEGEHHRTAANLHNIGARETRNRRTVWTVTTKPQPEAHFACFPPDLIEPCILAGAPSGGIVLDPFMGSGTTARVALSLGRQFIGCELNPAYIKIQDKIGLQAGMAL